MCERFIQNAFESLQNLNFRFFIKEDVHLDTFLKKFNSTFLNKMRLKIVSLDVWGPGEIIYHYDFIPSSTLFRSMKFRTQIGKSPYSPENPHILRRIWIFSYLCAELHADNKS